MAGVIIPCVVGILIGIGFIVGTVLQAKQGKISKGKEAIFYILGSIVTAAAVVSLIVGIK